MHTNNDNQVDRPSILWYLRLRSELKSSYPFFSLDECNGYDLDVEKTFAPSFILTLILRTLLLGVTVATMAGSIDSYLPENGWIWMGFLTHWTVVLTTAYFLAIIGCTTFRSTLKQPSKGEAPGLMVRLAWGLYSLVFPLNIVVVLLYWTVEYVPGLAVPWYSVMLHAGSALAVIIDGNVISCIPLRAKHLILLLSVLLVLGVWTLINDLTGIGDGEWPEEEDSNPNNQDDALYRVLDWSENPTSAAIASVVVFFVGLPVVFILCWSLTLWALWCKCDGSGRRLYDVERTPIIDGVGGSEVNLEEKEEVKI